AEVTYLVMHQRLQPAFANARVRQAFALAIDKDEIMRVAYKGAVSRADSLLPQGVPGFDPDAKPTGYDPAHATNLLAAASYPGGSGFPRLTLAYIGGRTSQSAMAQLIRSNLQTNLGLTIDLQERELVTFYTDTNDKEKIPFFISGWVADYCDPADF